VIGNWDQTVAGTVDNIDGYNTRAQCSAYWTRGALSPEEKRFLAGLPDTVIENGVQVVHARPGEGNPIKYIMSVEEAHEAAAAAQAPVVFHGHTHIAGVFFDEEPLSYSKDDEFTVPAGVTAVINVGAPGQPRDGDTRAIWCLYDTETRKGQFRRCEYDKETASRKIIESGQPSLLGERLLLGK
jgi:diadenosine tetraphosphatase ApaH/serine/threonine PP2A family protein phosphatase